MALTSVSIALHTSTVQQETNMKHVYISALFLSISLLAGCSGSSSSSSSSNTKPAASITITATNADSVAKGAMSSKDTAGTSTDSASGLKTSTLIADPAKKLSAMSLAMEHLKKAESLPFPSSVASRASLAGYPQSYVCTDLSLASGQTTNIVTYDFIDTDSSGTFNGGDVFTVSYTDCTLLSSSLALNG